MFEVRDVVDEFARKMPYWTRRNASDHFWVSGHDGGKYEYANLADPRLAANAHCITNTADPHREIRRDLPPHELYSFHPNRDVSAVAGASDKYWEDAWTIAKPLPERSTFAFFAGKLHSDGRDQGVRPALKRAFDGFTPDPSAGTAQSVRVGGYLPAAGYKAALADAVFCLCPRGSTVWSERLIDALVSRRRARFEPGGRIRTCAHRKGLKKGHTQCLDASLWSTDVISRRLVGNCCMVCGVQPPASTAAHNHTLIIRMTTQDPLTRPTTQVFGCIPVVVADTYWMPLSCFVDWPSFAVFVPQASANRTAHILDALPLEKRRQLHDNLMGVRHYFGFDTQLRHGPDAFEMLMLEIYLKAQFCQAA